MARRSIWRRLLGFIGGTAIATLALPGWLAAAELRAPQNVNVRPTSAQSSKLATASARAQIEGRPEDAIRLADQALQASPRDPWPRYTRGMALARMGQTEQALANLAESEQNFGPNDPWGRSIAIWGQAHTLAQAGRCAEARAVFDRYASFVAASSPTSADLARRYAADCRAPALPPEPASPPAPER